MPRKIDTRKLSADVRSKLGKARTQADRLRHSHNGTPGAIAAVSGIDERIANAEDGEREINEKGKKLRQLQSRSKSVDREI